MKKIFLTLILTIMIIFVSAQEQKSDVGVVFLHDTPWSEVVATAIKAKKLIFIDCYTVWCGPCQGLVRNTFPVKEVGDFYNANFINVKYDMEQKEGMNFRKSYPNDILNYPTLLFIDPVTLKIVHKFVGSRNPDEIIKEAHLALSGGGLTALQAQYEAGGRDFALVQKYVAALSSANQRAKMATVIDNYFTQNASFNDLYKPEVWNGFSGFIREAGIESQFVGFVMANNQRLRSMNFVDKAKLDNTLLDLLSMASADLIRPILLGGDSLCKFKQDKQQYQRLKGYLDRIDKKLPMNEIAAKLSIYDLMANGQWKDAFYAVKSARRFEFLFFNGNVFYLYSLAYIAQQSKDNQLLAEALNIALQDQKQGAAQFQNYNVNNIIAFLYKNSGDKKKYSEYKKEYERIKSIKEKTRNPNNIKNSH